MAACALAPHISAEGCRPAQQLGRPDWPKMLQRCSALSWIHLSPAGLPAGMPGIALLIDGAMQQAPQ